MKLQPKFVTHIRFGCLLRSALVPFLEGASHPDKLIEKTYGHCTPALALTERDGVYGMSATREGVGIGIAFAVGSQLIVNGESLTILAQDGQGYANLSRFLTLKRLRSENGITGTLQVEENVVHLVAEGLWEPKVGQIRSRFAETTRSKGELPIRVFIAGQLQLAKKGLSVGKIGLVPTTVRYLFACRAVVGTMKSF